MAFLASKGVLADVLANASRRAIHTKTMAQSWKATLLATNTQSSFIISIDGDILRIKAEMQGYASTTGIGTFAQTNTPDAPVGYNISAEWTAMMNALQGVSDWIRANFPVDAGGFLLARTWAADREFTPAQTAGLRTKLDELIATIA